MKGRPLRERLGFAAAGIRCCWARERSFRTQTAIAGFAFVTLIVLRPPLFWWALVGVSFALMLALEMLNSAMEAALDLLHPDIHPAIKMAKDMLAGAVLVMSLAALAVGVAMLLDTGPGFFREIGL